MSRDPAILYYDGDVSRDISFLSVTERGFYLNLIQYQILKKSRLKEDEINNLIPKEILEHMLKICIITVENGEYYIYWVDQSMKKRSQYSKSRRDNRNSNKTNPCVDDMSNICNSYVDDMSNICQTYVKHMENENENENINENENENKNKNIDTLEKREKNFSDEVMQYNDYDVDMLKAFVRYWTEPTRSKKKMKYETEKTWDTKRRLVNWSENEEKFGNHKIKIVDKPFG